jgi:hypothetical protein
MAVLACLRAMRGPGESYSDVILRIAESESLRARCAAFCPSGLTLPPGLELGFQPSLVSFLPGFFALAAGEVSGFGAVGIGVGRSTNPDTKISGERLPC